MRRRAHRMFLVLKQEQTFNFAKRSYLSIWGKVFLVYKNAFDYSFLLLIWPFGIFLLWVECHFVDSFCSYNYWMGTTCSAQEISDDEDYEIPPGETYRHRNCTVRAPHQLIIMQAPRNCDYCRIVKKLNVKTRYRCEKCQLNFCFNEQRNHFRKWHSAKFDYLQGYT